MIGEAFLKDGIKLQILPSLNGMGNVCYERDDGIYHIIIQTPPGTVFSVGNHFDLCPICKKHGVTLKDMDYFMSKLGLRAS